MVQVSRLEPTIYLSPDKFFLVKVMDYGRQEPSG